MRNMEEYDAFWPVHGIIFLFLGIRIFLYTESSMTQLLFYLIVTFDLLLMGYSLITHTLFRKVFKQFKTREQLKGAHSFFYVLKFI